MDPKHIFLGRWEGDEGKEEGKEGRKKKRQSVQIITWVDGWNG